MKKCLLGSNLKKGKKINPLNIFRIFEQLLCLIKPWITFPLQVHPPKKGIIKNKYILDNKYKKYIFEFLVYAHVKKKLILVNGSFF